MNFFRPQLYPPLFALSALLLLSSCLSGCSILTTPTPPSPSAASASVRTTANTSNSLDSVRALPLFQQAEQAYQKKQFQHAADLLARLAATAKLSAEQREFVQRQQEICLKPLQSKSPPQPPVKLPAVVSSPDCGPRALLLVCQKLGVKASVEQLKQLSGTSAKGTSLAGLAKAAKALGLQAEGVQVSREALLEVPLPALAWVNQNHFVVLLSVKEAGDQATVTVHDPNKTMQETIDREKFLRESSGYLLLVKK